MKIVTYMGTLMRFAKALGEAKKSGDPEAIAKAQLEHDTYKQLVLDSDECIMGPTELMGTGQRDLVRRTTHHF